MSVNGNHLRLSVALSPHYSTCVYTYTGCDMYECMKKRTSRSSCSLRRRGPVAQVANSRDRQLVYHLHLVLVALQVFVAHDDHVICKKTEVVQYKNTVCLVSTNSVLHKLHCSVIPVKLTTSMHATTSTAITSDSNGRSRACQPSINA
jgi:hypothetical protein